MCDALTCTSGISALDKEENLLQGSSLFDIERGASALCVVDKCQDGDCTTHSLGDRESLAAGVVLELIGHIGAQVHREAHQMIVPRAIWRRASGAIGASRRFQRFTSFAIPAYCVASLLLRCPTSQLLPTRLLHESPPH